MTRPSASKPSPIILHRLKPIFFFQLNSLYAGMKELSHLSVLTRKVVSDELRSLLNDWFVHLGRQMTRLGEIFSLAVVKPTEGKDNMITALVNSLKKMTAVKRGWGTDTWILIELQKLLYYNIGTYSSLELLASALGMEESVNLLHLSLEDEKDWMPVVEDIITRVMHEEPVGNH